MPFRGMVGLVTGGSSGIGFHSVRAFLKKNMKGVGFTCLTDKDGDEALKSLEDEFGKDRAIYIAGDSSVEKNSEKAFVDTIKKFGYLDVLCNNAGIAEENDEGWLRTVKTNGQGVILNTTLAMQKYLMKYRSKDEACIINIASVIGLHPFPLQPVYTGTKFGVIAFTRALGNETVFNDTKIKFMAVCPSLTMTKLIDTLPDGFTKILQEEDVKPQTPEQCGHLVGDILEKAENGTIYVAAQGVLHEVDFPTLKSLRQPFKESGIDSEV